MAKKLTYKKKFQYLLLTALLFSLVAYKLTIRNTLDIIGEMKNSKKQLIELSDAPMEINKLNGKLQKLNNSLNYLFTNSGTIQDVMLEQIASYCSDNHILIKHFPKAESLTQEDYTLETNHLILEGTYQKLLLLLYNIEQKYKLGKISSARFFKISDPKTKAVKLNVEIYIQNIRTHEKV